MVFYWDWVTILHFGKTDRVNGQDIAPCIVTDIEYDLVFIIPERGNILKFKDLGLGLPDEANGSPFVHQRVVGIFQNGVIQHIACHVVDVNETKPLVGCRVQNIGKDVIMPIIHLIKHILDGAMVHTQPSCRHHHQNA